MIDHYYKKKGDREQYYEMTYHMEGNFGGGNVGEFAESSLIRQTRTIQISTYH